jgi:polyisoprenyl-teichoic acid--peptidoglycan teichoic acid transferase
MVSMDNSHYEYDEILSEIQKNIGRQVEAELQYKPVQHIKKSLTWMKIPVIVLGLILVIGGSVLFASNYILNRINYESDADVAKLPEDEGLVANAKEVNLPDGKEYIGNDQKVINILLIGEEAMDDARGRSDAMIVATINQDQKSLKLTSFMRDTYVQIPGYINNKLNAAFNKGGGPLLCKTIENNFNLKIDGYVRVDFDDFKNIIDKLDGVEITLTKNEASYLNRTNYISNKADRNVVEGTQVLNGTQALGYSRIRYVKGITDEQDDQGRTSRQRIVLNAIFEKYKTKNIVELVDIANDILPLVTTNMKKKDIISYLATVVTLKVNKLETLRIPVDNGYKNEKLYIGNASRKTAVLIPDLQINYEELSKFIYGELN